MLGVFCLTMLLATCSMSLGATAPALPCIGDCNGDGRTRIDELLTGINILHGDTILQQCPALVGNADRLPSVDDALAGVRTALSGCRARCGDGIATDPEECDDGNLSDGDGCTATCRLEPGGDLCTGVPQNSGAQLRSVLVASGLSKPLYVTAPPRDVSRIFIVEQTGRIRIVKWGTLLPTPFLDLSPLISCCTERGLLSLAFHPEYASNGSFFVDYTDSQGNTVVSRWHVSDDPDVADPGSETIILRQTQPFANHNGGLVLFGPDGRLYVGFGDGGSAGDPQNNGQTLGTWLGKLLRINVDDPLLRYTVPPDNPFAGTVGALPEIWDLGLRNPWRFSFDRVTGELYIADVGQDAFEEVDVEPAGAGGKNYGWRLMEGAHCFEPPVACPMNGLTVPVLEYDHDQGCSITGGVVYRGCTIPDLRGTYLYADYCSNFIRSFIYTGGAVTDARDRTAELTDGGSTSILKIVSFGEDARGELYICDLRGFVYRIVAR